MMSDDLRQLIREVINEELTARRGCRTPLAGDPQERVETVSISTNEELSAFVRHIVTLAKDDKTSADIEYGRYTFSLSRAERSLGHSSPRSLESTIVPVRFDRGLITEAEIKKLSEGVTLVDAGDSVCFTPLARDELRKLGIKVRRTSS